MRTETIARPTSKLTAERPDIWNRALALATQTTGMHYLPKISGELVACGRLPHSEPKTDKPPAGKDYDWDWDYFSGEWKKYYREPAQKPVVPGVPAGDSDGNIKTLSVLVPDGEMEWLLHEVGHWVAATPAERKMPNYGYGQGFLLNGLGAEREWQAWGFEEIILAQHGPSRLLASPTQRDGIAYSKNGPMPDLALRHADRQMQRLGIDVQQWRGIYDEWVRWSADRRNTTH